jgi:hypothetical protein
MTKTGFELCGISQDTPLLKEFCESKGQKLNDFAQNKEYFLCRGFRDKILKKSKLQHFFCDGLKIPGEYHPFFSIISPQLNELVYRIQYFHTKTPYKDVLALIKSDNTDTELFDLQFRYISTGVKIIERMLKDAVGDSVDLLIDAWCILGEFYYLEGLLSVSNRDEAFVKNLPPSNLCPNCLGPKDNPSSELCKKCQQRKRRGTKLIGERYCGCGCGEIINGPPQKRYKNSTHARRKQGDRK